MSSIWDDELRALQRAVWDRVADEIATWFPQDDGGGA